MDLDLTVEQFELRDMVCEYARTKLAPRSAGVDATGEFPWESVREMGERGLFGMLVPAEHGGLGADFLSYILAVEELAAACMSTATIIEVVNSLVALPLHRFGSASQKERYLPRVASGKAIGACALTEPGAGSDPASMTTTAVGDGDGYGYVLNGTKIRVSNAPQSELFIVFAVTDPEGPRGRNISAFMVDRTDEGSLGLRVGEPEAKMGLNGIHTTSLELEAVKVPKDNRLGAEGEGMAIALATADAGRVTVAGQALGVARAALEAAVSYAGERTQFGRPIGSNQGLSFPLAECATRLEAARHMTYHAARLMDSGKPYGKEGAMAKLFASEMAAFVTDTAVQTFGGFGFCRDYPVERYYRDARILRLYEGTSEIQRLVIARHLGLKG